jgi:hypothetical protein
MQIIDWSITCVYLCTASQGTIFMGLIPKTGTEAASKLATCRGRPSNAPLDAVYTSVGPIINLASSAWSRLKHGAPILYARVLSCLYLRWFSNVT